MGDARIARAVDVGAKRLESLLWVRHVAVAQQGDFPEVMQRRVALGDRQRRYGDAAHAVSVKQVFCRQVVLDNQVAYRLRLGPCRNRLVEHVALRRIGVGGTVRAGQRELGAARVGELLALGRLGFFLLVGLGGCFPLLFCDHFCRARACQQGGLVGEPAQECPGIVLTHHRIDGRELAAAIGVLQPKGHAVRQQFVSLPCMALVVRPHVGAELARRRGQFTLELGVSWVAEVGEPGGAGPECVCELVGLDVIWGVAVLRHEVGLVHVFQHNLTSTRLAAGKTALALGDGDAALLERSV